MRKLTPTYELARHTNFDGDILHQAIAATFKHRNTALGVDVPFGLSDAFAQDAQKITQWKAFLNKNKLESVTLEEVVLLLREFLMPALTSASIDNNWQAGDVWLSKNI